MKKFDLNIEKVLENWEVCHALREVIANAIDEQLLTSSNDIEISKDDKNIWHIKDFGRGLKYEHLTQNENLEKLQKPELVIGRFGVGLKDALATFDRNHISVCIKSKYGDITIEKSTKHDFEDVVTLHAIIQDPSEPTMIGTDFQVKNVSDEDMRMAKEFFLKFSKETLLEKTTYGEVLQWNARMERHIYICGLKVAKEDNFLFSYNITSLTLAMRKALNRERTHVGRTAYTDRVKSILLACQSIKVGMPLINDLQKFQSGQSHDELKWVDIAAHASTILNSKEKVVFMTPEQLVSARNMTDMAEREGYKIITVPENVQRKLKNSLDILGDKVRVLDQFVQEQNNSFKFVFVDPANLPQDEQRIFAFTEQIMNQIGGRPHNVAEILISETMRIENTTVSETVSVWEPDRRRVIIKRSQLGSLKDYAGTLLHELAHATSGAGDVSRSFEDHLTKFLGVISAQNLSLIDSAKLPASTPVTPAPSSDPRLFRKRPHSQISVYDVESDEEEYSSSVTKPGPNA